MFSKKLSKKQCHNFVSAKDQSRKDRLRSQVTQRQNKIIEWVKKLKLKESSGLSQMDSTKYPEDDSKLMKITKMRAFDKTYNSVTKE